MTLRMFSDTGEVLAARSAPVEVGLTPRVYSRRGEELVCTAAALGTRTAEHSSECLEQSGN